MSLPNQLTVLRIVLTPLFALALIFDRQYLALSIFFLATLTDWYDGYVARTFDEFTSTGKYLDPLADKILISTTFGTLTYLGLLPFWMFLLMALRDVLITSLRSYAVSTTQPFETIRFAKWKTACQMGSIYLVLFWLIAKGNYVESQATQFLLQVDQELGLVYNLMFFVTIYTVTSGLVYLFENRRLLKRMVIAFYRVFVPTNVR